ncbi:MAG: hypothetical protein WC556_00685 [Candidatus Methanoperedens sp.]
MKKSILFVLLLLFIPLAQAVPPVTSYWGYVTYNSVPLSNALVTVIDSTGKTVAGSTSNQDGTYTVNVLWDDLSTAADEGVISGESLTFEVNRETATTTTIGLQGESLRLDLAASSGSSSGSSGGSSSGGYYPSTSTGAVQATATAVKTATTTATPVAAKTEVPAATTAKPVATETTKEPTSGPTTPGFGAIIAVFAIAMIASMLKNNKNRR